MLSGRWTEEEPKTIEHFVQQLYFQEYKLCEEPEAGNARMLEPVHLYVLAETYNVLKLKNNVCRLVYDGRSTQGLGVAKDPVTYAYDKSLQN